MFFYAPTTFQERFGGRGLGGREGMMKVIVEEVGESPLL